MPVKKLIFLLVVLPLAGYILYLSKTIISPFILAFFLAYAINPLVEFLQKKGARREYAILTVYIALIIIGALIIGIIVPWLVEDLTKVLQKLPNIYQDVENLGERLNRLYWKLPLNIKPVVGQIVEGLEVSLHNTLIQMAETTVNLLSRALIFILVPILAYYINRDYPRLKQKSYYWLTHNLGNHWTRTFLKLDMVLKIYIRGQLLTTTILGAFIGLGLGLLGFEAAFLLGLIAGVFNLIPYFGPVLGATPVVLLALLRSPWIALYVVILFFVINQLEVMILVPRIIGGGLKIHPITVVYLILVGSKIGGLVGMVFAVPLGTIVLILIKSFYETSFGLANNAPIPEKKDLNDLEFD